MRQYNKEIGNSLFLILIIGLGLFVLKYNVTYKNDETLSSQLVLNKPFYLTSIGQSIDLVYMKLILEEFDLLTSVDPLLTSDKVEAGTLFITLGSSNKGMASAGITIEDEMIRAKTLTEEFDGLIVAVHFGGRERRGDVSDLLMSPILEKTDLLMVLSDSNFDGLFSEYAETYGIELHVLERVGDARVILEDVVK